MKTKERILLTSWKLLEKQLGRDVHMADIAKGAGISRQALYLHFKSRADLLLATTKYIDEVSDVDSMLAVSRQATNGFERLSAYIDAWGGYIPKIYGVAKALIIMQDVDEASQIAWNDRKQAIRHGCKAAVEALKKDGNLAKGLSVDKATDVLWMQLSVRNWEILITECNWSQDEYISFMKSQALATITNKFE